MRSRIYTGTLDHRRYLPVDHSLSYPIYVYGIDLDELSALNRQYPLFGHNRIGVASIYDRDYLEPGDLPLRQKILNLLAAREVHSPVARIITITSARYFTYVFNPVNFHYCLSPDSRPVAVIAEVNNTYGERHPYVLIENTADETSPWFATFETPKVFHVSPFNRVEGRYRFYFSRPGDRLEIKIELVNLGKTVMAATLKGEARPLTPGSHLATMIRYPATPHLSIPRIYAHAFRLFFRKKLSFNDKPVPRDPMTMKKRHPNLLESLCRPIVFSALNKITIGRLKVVLPDQTVRWFGNPDAPDPAVMQVKDHHFFLRTVTDGEIGFGEGFMHGEWDTPDLVALTALLIQNRDRFSDGNLMLSLVTRLKEKTAHDRRKNTIAQTPDNIRAHYDLSNEFYAAFLDRKMLYSCGIFASADTSLEQAQIRKMQRILDQAGIRDSDHILEIGCGWGGFALFAARQTGCRVTGITVSLAQYDLACRRVKDEGLEDRITILLQDYRHTQGQFDHIVSIEMIEAVGPQYFATYFRQARALLKPGGRMVFQAITIDDDRYERYCKERDWIQKHIFPGGHLPCLNILEQTISTHTDFEIADVFHMGKDYARTLACWRERFLAQGDEIAEMGFDEVFRRKWRYYFSICEAGFTVGGIDDIQVTLAG